MRRTKLVEMIPLDAPSECSYNCVGCKHLRGVVYYGNDDVEVKCDIKNLDACCGSRMFTKIAKKLETLFGVPAIVWMTWQDVDELNKDKV